MIELVSIVLVISTYSHQTEPLRILFLAFLTVLFADLASIPFPSFSYSELALWEYTVTRMASVDFCFLALPLFALAIFDRRIARRRLTAGSLRFARSVSCCSHIQRPLSDFRGQLLF